MQQTQCWVLALPVFVSRVIQTQFNGAHKVIGVASLKFNEHVTLETDIIKMYVKHGYYSCNNFLNYQEVKEICFGFVPQLFSFKIC